jgi:hypothetical protein
VATVSRHKISYVSDLNRHIPRVARRRVAVSCWHMQTRARLIRFGIFEVNLDSGELRRSGVKVKLQGSLCRRC